MKHHIEGDPVTASGPQGGRLELSGIFTLSVPGHSMLEPDSCNRLNLQDINSIFDFGINSALLKGNHTADLVTHFRWGVILCEWL